MDLETTGGQAARDRVIEAGIVLIEDGAVVEEYSTLVNPGTHIPYAIQQFTGITEAMVADAPPFAAVADDIAARLDGRLFVAHNARFDYGFLRSEFRRLERRLRAPVLCTVRLSRALTPAERGHSLDAVMNRHGIACDARHRALGDARVVAEFLGIARAEWPADELAAIVQRLTGTTRLPPQIDPALADELPEGPGRLPLLRRGRCAPVRRQGEEPGEPRAEALRRAAGEARAAAHARWCGASSGSRPPASSARF